MITPKLVAKSCVFCNRDVPCLPGETFPICLQCQTDMPDARKEAKEAERESEAGGAN